MANPIMKFFSSKEPPFEYQQRGICDDVASLAERMEALLPDSAEKSAGLRKLLEARECFLRASYPPPVVIGS